MERINVKAILRRHGLRPKRSFSQNFLVDPGVLQGIAGAASLHDAEPVVELGAGLGALTAMLSREAGRVVAVERDRDLARVLRGEFAGEPKVEVLEANAARLDWAELRARLGRPPVVVGNLPYHMASQILFHLLEAGTNIDRFLIMVQREMAERMTSVPGGRDWGVLSVQLQLRADVEIVLRVPPDAFHPAPRVHSAVVRGRPLARPRVPLSDAELFRRLVRGVFNQRRKKIRNGLRATFPALESGAVDLALAGAGISPLQRPEQLGLAELARLVDCVERELARVSCVGASSPGEPGGDLGEARVEPPVVQPVGRNRG